MFDEFIEVVTTREELDELADVLVRGCACCSLAACALNCNPRNRVESGIAEWKPTPGGGTSLSRPLDIAETQRHPGNVNYHSNGKTFDRLRS
jgi:hypothetical protein